MPRLMDTPPPDPGEIRAGVSGAGSPEAVPGRKGRLSGAPSEDELRAGLAGSLLSPSDRSPASGAEGNRKFRSTADFMAENGIDGSRRGSERWKGIKTQFERLPAPLRSMLSSAEFQQTALTAGGLAIMKIAIIQATGQNFDAFETAGYGFLTGFARSVLYEKFHKSGDKGWKLGGRIIASSLLSALAAGGTAYAKEIGAAPSGTESVMEDVIYNTFTKLGWGAGIGAGTAAINETISKIRGKERHWKRSLVTGAILGGAFATVGDGVRGLTSLVSGESGGRAQFHAISALAEAGAGGAVGAFYKKNRVGGAIAGAALATAVGAAVVEGLNYVTNGKAFEDGFPGISKGIDVPQTLNPQIDAAATLEPSKVSSPQSLEAPAPLTSTPSPSAQARAAEILTPTSTKVPEVAATPAPSNPSVGVSLTEAAEDRGTSRLKGDLIGTAVGAGIGAATGGKMAGRKGALAGGIGGAALGFVAADLLQSDTYKGSDSPAALDGPNVTTEAKPQPTSGAVSQTVPAVPRDGELVSPGAIPGGDNAIKDNPEIVEAARRAAKAKDLIENRLGIEPGLVNPNIQENIDYLLQSSPNASVGHLNISDRDILQSLAQNSSLADSQMDTINLTEADKYYEALGVGENVSSLKGEIEGRIAEMFLQDNEFMAQRDLIIQDLINSSNTDPGVRHALEEMQKEIAAAAQEGRSPQIHFTPGNGAYQAIFDKFVEVDQVRYKRVFDAAYVLSKAANINNPGAFKAPDLFNHNVPIKVPKLELMKKIYSL